MTYIATAKRGDHGWELHVEDVGVTQCTTLDRVDRQVRDYLATMLDIDRLDDDITIRAGAVSERPSRA